MKGGRKREGNICLVYLKSPSVGGGGVRSLPIRFQEHLCWLSGGLWLSIRTENDLQKLSSYSEDIVAQAV